MGDTVAVKAAGGNDDGQPTSLCAQERQGTTGAWHTLACTPVTVDPTPHLRLRVRAVHPGTMQFRALLSETDAKTHRPRLLSRSSTEGVSVTR
ncbi:hypothetical protein ACJ6WE_01370 [Streptomyces sp. MMS24-I31]|uniref:hypothetical protein n=1 Tax=Streptomyces sp. MMS24-I31 TaxID=3351563 RepID=UPI003896BBBC